MHIAHGAPDTGKADFPASGRRPQHDVRLLRERDVDRELLQERPLRVEHLDPAIRAVARIDVALGRRWRSYEVMLNCPGSCRGFPRSSATSPADRLSRRASCCSRRR